MDPHSLTRHHPGICCHAYRIVQSSVHLSPITDGGLFVVSIDVTFHCAHSILGFVRMRSLRDGTFVLRRSCTFKSTRARVLVHGWYGGSARVRGARSTSGNGSGSGSIFRQVGRCARMRIVCRKGARCVVSEGMMDSHLGPTDGPEPRDTRISYYWTTGARARLLLGQMAARREGEVVMAAIIIVMVMAVGLSSLALPTLTGVPYFPRARILTNHDKSCRQYYCLIVPRARWAIVLRLRAPGYRILQ